MDDTEDLRARVDGLEAKLTHQELALEDLNAALTRQWQHIDRLVRQVTLLTERLQDMSPGGDGAAPADSPPPHY